MDTYRYIICIYTHTYTYIYIYIHTGFSLLWLDGGSAKNLLIPPSPAPKVNPPLTTKQKFSSYNATAFLAAVIALDPFLF